MNNGCLVAVVFIVFGACFFLVDSTTHTTTNEQESPHCVVRKNFSQRTITHCDDGSATVTDGDKFIYCSTGKNGSPSCHEVTLGDGDK